MENMVIFPCHIFFSLFYVNRIKHELRSLFFLLLLLLKRMSVQLVFFILDSIKAIKKN